MQAVTEMDSIFQGAPANVQARFQSAHDSIMAEYNSYSSITCYIELYNGAVCSLGVQATQLANRIQSAMGQEGTPDAGTTAWDPTTILVVVAVGYLAILVLPSLLRK
jgi:hypothetical protein